LDDVLVKEGVKAKSRAENAVAFTMQELSVGWCVFRCVSIWYWTEFLTGYELSATFAT